MSNIKQILASLAFATGSHDLYQLITPEKKPNRYEIEEMVKEYKLIQEKKSELPRNQRNLVEHQVKRWIRKGYINEDLTTHIKIK